MGLTPFEQFRKVDKLESNSNLVSFRRVFSPLARQPKNKRIMANSFMVILCLEAKRKEWSYI